jgi:polysaccharide biosynthesis transport protein
MTARAASLADRLAVLRRRRVPALALALVVLLAALVGAFMWPATYRSTGTILIEQQEVPVDLVRSMVSSYADQRIQVISQRVMTTDNLMRIIDRYDLYPEDRRTTPREVLLGRMRSDVKFSMISADVVDPRLGRPTKATIAFSVSYDNRSPQLAAKVATEITNLYLTENLENRKQLADDADAFLSAEAERLSKQIAELDAKLAKFKEDNVDRLPELTHLNLQLMARAEEELRETDTRLRALDQQIVYLDAQLAQLDPTSQIHTASGERVLSPADRLKVLKSEFARANAIYAAGHPDVARMKREIEGLEREVGRIDDGNELARQLREAQGQLAQARERYAADHPDVQQLEKVVGAIEASMAAAPLTAEATRAREPDNPAYIQVSAQREATANERASLESKRGVLRAKINELEQRLAQSPGIEREYSALVRELDNALLKYREVRQKQMEAALAKNLETERKAERFTLIEPPLVAEKPVSPNRPAIVVLGVVLAIAAAVGIVALLELLDATVRSRRDLEALLPVAPLALLPWIETPAERAKRTRYWRYSLAGAAASAVAVIVLAHYFYRPLDVLWQVALRRLTG